MSEALGKWLKSGRYLPCILRDFHDQKDLFKAIHHTIKVDERDMISDVDWVKGQIYVIDVFLWWMARRGYTLQRSRTKLEYIDLDQTIKQCRDERTAMFNAALTK